MTARCLWGMSSKCTARGLATSAGTHNASSSHVLLPVVAGVALGTGLWLYADKNKAYARNWATDGALMYPASANYPDLGKHNNTMAKFLTPSVSL